MLTSNICDLGIGRTAPKLALAAAISLGAVNVALAADHLVSAQTATFDCAKVRPGDTVTLQSGTRGPLAIKNCSASSSNPIIIRNDPRGSGPVVIRRATGSGGGFVFSCTSCIGVEIDGSYKWQGAPSDKTYGIKVTMTGGGAPSAFVKVDGMSRFVAIRNVEVDGAWPKLASNGIGISVNDHKIKRSSHPGLWRESYLIEHNYVHNVEGEGMYIGSGYRYGNLPLRNIEIRYNLIEDTGWEAINTKLMLAGENSVHHNVIRRAGAKETTPNKTSQYSGINNMSGTVDIYNNWIEKTGQHGILLWTLDGPNESETGPPLEARVWNNVIIDVGALWRPFMSGSYGINVGAQSGVKKPIAFIYNNTFVNSRESAIHLTSNAGEGLVSDNIVADSGGKGISALSFIKQINNRIGAVSQMGFVDPGRNNFRLRADSPARNHGEQLRAQTDYDDVARPQDGAPDQGAFEHVTGDIVYAPQPPDGLAVE